MLIALAGILSIAVLGLPVVLALDRNARGGMLIGLAFLYGCGLVHFVLLGLSVARISWSLITVQVALIVTSALLLLLATRRAAAPDAVKPASRSSRDAISVVLDAATVVTVVVFAAFATAAKLWQWDFWAIWGLKARVFFDGGGVDFEFLTCPANAFSHPDYPLLLTLQYDYLSLLAGGWEDRWAGLLTPAFSAALLLIIRDIAGRRLPARSAAGVTLAATAFAVTPFVGLADAPLIACITAALLMASRAADDAVAMRHAAVLLGLATLAKNEGLAFLCATALALFVVRRPRHIARLWPAVAIAAPWLVIRWLYRLETDVASGPLAERFAAHAGEAGTLARLLISRVAEPWVAVLVIIGATLFAKSLRRYSLIVAAVAFQFLFYVAAYMVSPHPVAWHVTTSWPRISAHLLSPLLVAVMLTLAERFELAEDAPDAEARQEL